MRYQSSGQLLQFQMRLDHSVHCEHRTIEVLRHYIDGKLTLRPFLAYWTGHSASLREPRQCVITLVFKKRPPVPNSDSIIVVMSGRFVVEFVLLRTRMNPPNRDVV
jgi:hypothetical protein